VRPIRRTYKPARGALTRCPAALTHQGTAILVRCAVGDTDREIALNIGISEHTVHSHIDRLRDKIRFGVRRNADLTRFAIEYGIVPDLVDRTPPAEEGQDYPPPAAWLLSAKTDLRRRITPSRHG
jgi:DNA-binding CsgD family transcriptional regulator